MTKLRPQQQRGPAKKLTPEVLRDNPFLASLIRERLRQQKAARKAKRATELDLD